jgi:hypothetical protein
MIKHFIMRINHKHASLTVISVQNLCIVVLATLFFSACQFGPSPEERARMEMLRNDSVAMVHRAMEIEELEQYRDALLLNFNFHTEEQLYYHRHWDERKNSDYNYTITYVDGSGSLVFETLRLNDPGEAQHNRDDLVVVDSVFSTGTTGSGYTQEILTDHHVEHTTFPTDKSMLLGSVIARHLKDEVEIRTYFDDQMYESYIIPHDDKTAIYDCVELSKTMKALSELEQ